MVRTLHALIAAAAFIALSACTVHKQSDAPPLTGPSTSATQVNVTVSPAILTQDGASQSIVSIAAFGPSGQPLPNLQLRTEIGVDGTITDFGRLSARNVVTDGSGHASLIYTAPPAPIIVVNGGTTVAILVTPTSTGDAANSLTQSATIRLVPPGIVIAASGLVPDFTVSPTAPNAGDTATLSASFTDPSNTHQTAVSFQWDFGDGTSGSGQTVSHVFRTTGVSIVTLTLTDNLGHLASVTHSVTIGAATTTAPVFFTTPASPVSGQNIIFNASQTQPPPGHTISGYFWDFGDGSDGATGAVVTHMFAASGTYTVLLRVTLDNGAQATSAQTLVVARPNPKAVINLSPPTATVGQTITLLGNQSTPAPGRTIASYTWNFGDGSNTVSGSNSAVTHVYSAKGSYTVTLLVTDDQGNQDLATAQITIN